MAIDWGTWAPLISQGVSVAGQIAKSRQQGREAQATAQVPVDQLNQRAYETDLSAKRQGLEAQDAALLARAVGMLQEQAAARQAPGERASNAVRGDILANAQDATFSGSSRIPKFEFGGGLRPSMLSSNTRQLGSEMSRQALLDQLKGESTPFSDLPAADYSSIINAPGSPGGTALPQGGKMDTILQAIGEYGGLGVNAMGALNRPEVQIPQSQQPTPVTQMPGQMVAPPGPPPVYQQPVARGGTGTITPSRFY